MGGVLRRVRGRIRGDVLVVVAALVAAGLVASTASWPAGAEPATVLLSAAPDGSEGDGPYHAAAPAVSQDGAHVAFASAAANLVDGDGNNAVDVFVRDRGPDGTWKTTVVSARPSGELGNDDSYSPAISADGSVVAFTSEASNLAGGGGDGQPDVFVWRRADQTATRISRGLLGGLANGASYQPSVSADGSVVAFASDAANLVIGDLNGLTDVFVWRRNPLTRLVRVLTHLLGEPSGGSYQPVVSADGSVVAFASDADNLVGDDDNGTMDVFVHDRARGATSLVSRGKDGAAGDGPSFFPSLSAGGERVAFVSMAANMGAGDGYQPNVYLHDRSSGSTKLVSVGAGGEPADSSSFSPVISADGRYVAFDSAAGNLVGGDGNGTGDVFVHDTLSGVTSLASADAGGVRAGQAQALYPGISPAGDYVAFAVVPLDWSSTQYYLRGEALGGGVPPATDPPEQEPEETTTSSSTTTSTTSAPPTSTTSTAVTETTGG
jgi:Tol biopolymer transport system component